MNNIIFELSQRLKILRKRQNITQDEISKSLHLNRSTYAYYESGKIAPALQTIVALSEFYNVSIDYLLKGKDSSGHADLPLKGRKDLREFFHCRKAEEERGPAPADNNAAAVKKGR